MTTHFPSDFVQRIRQQFGDESDAFLHSFSQKPPVSIRLNPLKPLFNSNLTDKIPWSPNGRYLETRPNFALDPFFHAGCYYVQEASSMWVGKVVQYLNEQFQISTALDLCAAPGGKSTDLRATLPTSTTLLSNEIIRNRFNILEENLVKWGHPGIILTNRSPKQLEKTGDIFDLILVDAPCSGEGLFRKDKGAISHWNQSNLEMCSLRQKDILKSASKLLKPGGVLLYSTCTFNPAENEDICAWAINEFEWDSIEIPNEISDLPEKVPYKDGIGYRCRPDINKGEGLYFALFHKPRGLRSSSKAKSKTQKPVTMADYDKYSYLPPLKDNYFPAVLRDSQIVWLNESMQRAIPILNKAKIPFITPPIGRIKGKSIIPEHYAAMMNMDYYDYVIDVDLKQALEFFRLGWDPQLKVENGWNLVRYSGANLGWVKGIDGKRVNNYYPRGFRLRM